MVEVKSVLGAVGGGQLLPPPLMDHVKVFLGEQKLQMAAPNCIRLAKDALLRGAESWCLLILSSSLSGLLGGKLGLPEAGFQKKLFLGMTSLTIRLEGGVEGVCVCVVCV